MGQFKVKKVTNLSDIGLETTIPESDHSILTQDNKFVQFEYIEDTNESTKYKVGPGTYVVQKTFRGMELEKTSFVQDKILDSFVHTKDVTERIDCFFKNIHVYYEEGFDVPKRAIMLYGPAGSGKTTIISKVTTEYVKDNKTAVIVWPSDKFEAYTVKDFIKTFEYVNGVEKIIFIIEDIGGVEIDQVKMRSDSSLLSLLDNQEKTFSIPTLIIATTNFPEIFLGNITNRPGRFDDKIAVSYPDSEQRIKLLKFFLKRELTEDETKFMASKKTEEFSPAHIKEGIIRSRIYDRKLLDVLEELYKEIEHYKSAFTRSKTMGFNL